MGLKRPLSDEETSPVKLNDEAEAALSVLSPISPPVQFSRRLSKYQKVLSPGVAAYASNVIACYPCYVEKSILYKLNYTLKVIKDQLEQRLTFVFDMGVDWRSYSSMNDRARPRKELEEEEERRRRALTIQQQREAVAGRPLKGRRLQFAGGRELQPRSLS